jgi:hypothetical protein
MRFPKPSRRESATVGIDQYRDMVPGQASSICRRYAPMSRMTDTKFSKGQSPRTSHSRRMTHARPFTATQLSDWFRRRCDEAGHCSANGLRKSAATFHAGNGCIAHDLMAILGWLSLSEVERYTRKADRKHNAERGMQRVAIKSRTGSVQPRFQRCLTSLT